MNSPHPERRSSDHKEDLAKALRAHHAPHLPETHHHYELGSATDSSATMKTVHVTDPEEAPPSNKKNDAHKETQDGEEEQEDEMVSIVDDVYNMFFLSKLFGQAFFFAIYIFSLKMAFFLFLILDAIDAPIPDEVEHKVVAAQFLMLPVAVAMQQDLVSTYYLIANIRYDRAIKAENPHTNEFQYHVANLCRGIDGMLSLLVNFIILVKADAVLSLFLNFAALQFLQYIDNLALDLAANGYLTESLEQVACNVKKAHLPRKHHAVMNVLDSVLFLSTYVALIVAWGYVRFG